MAYHTMLFLLVFLPLILICYQIAGTKYRPYVLLAAGYIFLLLSVGYFYCICLGRRLSCMRQDSGSITSDRSSKKRKMGLRAVR